MDIKEIMELGVEMDRLKKENQAYKDLWNTEVNKSIEEACRNIKCNIMHDIVRFDTKLVVDFGKVDISIVSKFADNDPRVYDKFFAQLSDKMNAEVIMRLWKGRVNY